ncbi:MAG: hypothetical protein KAJ40_04580 [Alphaproteobacteria bacterium]|nr:hypothetical protein [Alphaproteobacteria bacterium]
MKAYRRGFLLSFVVIAIIFFGTSVSYAADWLSIVKDTIPDVEDVVKSHGTSIFPKQIIFEENDRVIVLTVYNGTNETMVYSFYWEQDTRPSNGKTVSSSHSVDQSLELSRSATVIRSKQSERLRVLIKQPSNLQKGNYHSNILIKGLPIAKGENDSQKMEILIPIFIK